MTNEEIYRELEAIEIGLLLDLKDDRDFRTPADEAQTLELLKLTREGLNKISTYSPRDPHK